MPFDHGNLSWYNKSSADPGEAEISVADIDGYTNPSNVLELSKIMYTINPVLYPRSQATYSKSSVPSTVA